jgi:hypothetical protein
MGPPGGSTRLALDWGKAEARTARY